MILSLLTNTGLPIQPSVFGQNDTSGFLCYMHFGNVTHHKEVNNCYILITSISVAKPFICI